MIVRDVSIKVPGMISTQIDEIVTSWSVNEKRAALELLLRKLLPPYTPTEAERQAARDELARRYATRDQAVDISEVLGRRGESDKTARS